MVWLTIIGVWIIDRFLKVLIQTNFIPGETLIVIPKVFHLTFVLNPGAAFGLLAGQTWIFVVTALLVLGGVIFGQFYIPRRERLTRLAIGMIGGGALGNLYDRVVIGRVIDYLDFQIWPYVFNFADSMIVLAVGILMLLIYRQENAQGKKGKPEKSPPGYNEADR
jgi:signal peptidase II